MLMLKEVCMLKDSMLMQEGSMLKLKDSSMLTKGGKYADAKG